MTQVNEVSSRDIDIATFLDYLFVASILRGFKVGIIRKSGIAADPKKILDSSLGRQAVIVPPHRVEHFGTAHALIPSNSVCMGVTEYMPDMQGSTHCRWRGIDAKNFFPAFTPVELVDAVLFPYFVPFGFKAFNGWSVRNPCHDVNGILSILVTQGISAEMIRSNPEEIIQKVAGKYPIVPIALRTLASHHYFDFFAPVSRC